ncbi:MAG: MBL fold metallo-hydrolase [Firmicutes bacterium]|nr:MBL fold metallo-hydrolase [Bacillota bacterium]
MEIKTIVGHYGSNTFVINHLDKTIIIDAGAKPVDLQKALGGKLPDAIFLTHEHFDHVYYIEEYKKLFDCPVYIPPSEDKIVIGGLVVKPILCPGHSPQSVVYLIEDILFTGDVLFSDTIGRTDFMPNGWELMQGSLRKLLDVKFKIAYHGHGEPSDYDEQIMNIQSFL